MRCCGGAPSDERFAAAAAVGRSVADTLAAGPQRTALLAWAAVVAFLIVGGRELITDGVPAIGQLAPLPDSATDLFRTFTSGWRTIGLGTTAAAPTAFAGVAFAGIALFGQMGLLHTLLALLPMLIGLIGMWRLTAPIGSVRPRIASLVVYAAVPLPYNAISNGRWDGLVAYAALPWVLSHLAGASELAPFDAPATPPVVVERDRSRRRHRARDGGRAVRAGAGGDGGDLDRPRLGARRRMAGRVASVRCGGGCSRRCGGAAPAVVGDGALARQRLVRVRRRGAGRSGHALTW